MQAFPRAALAACLILFTLSSTERSAWADPPQARPSIGYLSVQAENDVFGNGADRDYTHGTAVNYFSEPCQFQWVERTAKALGLAPREGPECDRTRVGFGIGQAIFTPTDISREVPDPTDRPYAGWLYLSASLVTEMTHDPGPTPSPWLDRSMRKLEVSLGVVGPASGASVVQREFHKIIGAQEPRGWTYQLENEPTLLISYEYLRRFGRSLGRYLEVDATPSAGVSLGNVFTYGSLGATFRIGSDMLQDYGPPRIRPSLGAGGAFFEKPLSGIGWYIFAGFEGRAVAHNIFLDGNTFVSGPHVDKRDFVGDAQVGLAITLGGVRLSYTNVFRTKEFSGQKEPDDFGAVTASFRL